MLIAIGVLRMSRKRSIKGKGKRAPTPLELRSSVRKTKPWVLRWELHTPPQMKQMTEGVPKRGEKYITCISKGPSERRQSEMHKKKKKVEKDKTGIRSSGPDPRKYV